MADTAKEPGLLRRGIQAVQYVIGNVKPNTWFGPQQPLQPMAQEVKGRLWDYPVAVNLNYRPRAQEALSFATLAAMSEACGILRLVIETRKDQMSALNWIIRKRKVVGEVLTKKEEQDDPRVVAITKFLQKPSATQDWSQWLRQVLEQLFVYDAVSIERVRNRGGMLQTLEALDGATITVMLDADGQTPEAPSVAYQQILKGLPAVDFSTDDLLYYPHNRRAGHAYGYPIVQQIADYVNLAVKRVREQSAAYDSANSPHGIMEGAETLTVDQISGLQQYWDSILSGQLEARSQVLWVPSGSTYHEINKEVLFDEFDEWLARVICFAFSISPQPFVKMMNRATASTAQDTAASEGLLPTQQYIKRMMDQIIASDFNSPELEFAWDESKELDPKVQAEVHDTYLKNGTLALDEVREDLGKPGWGGSSAKGMVLTATGYIPIDPDEAADLKLKSMPPPAIPGGGIDPATGKPAAPRPPGGAGLGLPVAGVKPGVKSGKPAAKLAKSEGLFRVQRVLLNPEPVMTWAKAAGFSTPPREFVLECMVTDVSALDDQMYVLKDYSARLFRNDAGHVVMTFDAGDLSDQWRQMLGAGLDFEDVPEFAPGVTVDFTSANKSLPAVHLSEPLLFGEQTYENLGKTWDDAAHDADYTPTEGQRRAGNYKKGHIKFRDLDLSIETPAGGARQGNGWSVLMPHHYGYIKGTVGADGEHVDVFVGPNDKSDRVWVIDQTDHKTGTFDEHKVMVGFDTWSAAREAYAASYTDGKEDIRIGNACMLTYDQFKEWLATADLRQPCAMAKDVTQATGLVNYSVRERKELDRANYSIPEAIAQKLKKPEDQKLWQQTYEKLCRTEKPGMAKAMAMAAVRANRAEVGKAGRRPFSAGPAIAKLSDFTIAGDYVRKAMTSAEVQRRLKLLEAKHGGRIHMLDQSYANGKVAAYKRVILKGLKAAKPSVVAAAKKILDQHADKIATYSKRVRAQMELRKFNENHDDKGRFSEGPGGGAGKPDLPEKFQIKGAAPAGAISGMVTTAISAKFTAVSGYSAQELTGLLGRNLPSGYKIEMTMGKVDGKTKQLVGGWEITDAHGSPAGEFYRAWSPDGKTVDHRLMELTQDAQAAGIGRTILGNAMAVYEKSGVEHVRLEAGMAVGGYAWAKFGFVPYKGEWDEVRDKLNWVHNPVGNRGFGMFPEGSRDGITAALKDSDPHAIWRIADMKQPVVNYPSLDVEGHSYPRTTVGKALLMGQAWKGQLDLNDAQAMARFTKYVASEPVRKTDVVGRKLTQDEIAFAIVEEHDGSDFSKLAKFNENHDDKGRFAEGDSAGGGKQTDTKAFKEWFGASKVVDAAGKPQVLYHGTARDFSEFSLDQAGTMGGSEAQRVIFVSTDKDTANHYADVAGAGYDENPTAQNQGTVYPVYVRAENPYVSKLAQYNTAAFERDIAKAQKLGHDSIMFPKIKYGGESGTVAVFHPNQVKSAIGNQGTFSRTDPDITKLEKAGDDNSDELDWESLFAEMAAAIAAAMDENQIRIIIEDTGGIAADVAGEAGREVLVGFGAEDAMLTNRIDARTANWAQDRSAEMVGMRWQAGVLVPSNNAEMRIDEATRLMVRNIIYEGLIDGNTRDEMVELLEGIGFYPFSEERATLIADTEIARAHSQGSLAAGEEIAAEGTPVKKYWMVADGPCPICEENEQEGKIELDEDFPSGDDTPPAHPNCRCALGMVAGARAVEEEVDDEEE